MKPEFELVDLKAGGKSLRPKGGGEIFHPVVGPMTEARILHVQQQHLAERAAVHDPFVVWDVGLGAAANATAALEVLKNSPHRVELHSFDLHAEALRFAVMHAETLQYPLAEIPVLKGLLECGHAELGPVRWVVHYGDFYSQLGKAPAPHAIFYDPYSPQMNPEMWGLEPLELLYSKLTQPCLWTNYTRSTAVRVTLLLAGFYVGFGSGVGEKDQTTVASNEPVLIDSLLPLEWLQRVRRSTSGAPLRQGHARGAISSEDWQKLVEHPQFRDAARASNRDSTKSTHLPADRPDGSFL